MGHLYQRQWFKYTCAVLAGGYIYLLVISNLIGFGYGIDNAHILL